jgi:hypothetical protein
MRHSHVYIQGRSGSVALPRTKVVLAMAAARLGAAARRAERAVEVRRRVADMIGKSIEASAGMIRALQMGRNREMYMRWRGRWRF